MTSRSGSQPCATWEYDYCHSCSYHYASANPLSGWYHWTSLRCHHGHKPTSPRGSWNGFSKLPLQHPPLSPSIVHPGKSHHWWPWEPHPQQQELKVPLDKRRLTKPFLPQWQPSHRPPCEWPHLLIPPALPTPFINCSNQLYHRH